MRPRIALSFGFAFSPVASGYRMSKPKKAPSSVFDCMMECWNSRPNHRPTAAQLHKYVEVRKNEAEAHCSSPTISPFPP